MINYYKSTNQIIMIQKKGGNIEARVMSIKDHVS